MITAFFAPKSSTSTSSSSSSKAVKRKAEDDQSKSSTPRALTEEVALLISYLHVDGWQNALERYFTTTSFAALAKFVTKERLSQTAVYPPPQLVFSAMNLTPLSEVKVVIVGQDPYHQPGQGHGLSFSVPHGVTIPPSLRNIYKELMNDVNIPEFDIVPKHGNLERWAKQGVLLLNNVLTVRKGEPDSHKKRGWEEFTDRVIEAVVSRDAERGVVEGDTTNDKDEEEDGRGGGTGVVFLLWGKPASLKAQTVLAKCKNNKRHAVITCSHPSPLGATKTSSPFIGSRCFSRANDELLKRGWKHIDWRVDGTLE
jgi:uracil-DNA glycosylase